MYLHIDGDQVDRGMTTLMAGQMNWAALYAKNEHVLVENRRMFLK
jgi:hypothetical protein